jgi:hypothetical protein
MRNDRFVLARNLTSELACWLRDSTPNTCQGIFDVRLTRHGSFLSSLSNAGCSRHPSTCSVRTDDTAQHSMYRSGTMNWQLPEHSKPVNVREETKMNLCVAAQAYGSCYNRTGPVSYHPVCYILLTAGITSTLSLSAIPGASFGWGLWDTSVVNCLCIGYDTTLELVLNVMAHARKPDFVFRRNGRVHLNRRGSQFRRLLAAEVCASAVVMLDTSRSEVVWRVLATHSIRQFPLHFPSRASPCSITFQLDPTSLLCCLYVRNKSRDVPADVGLLVVKL